MLTLGTSCDAANCNQHQQIPTFVMSSHLPTDESDNAVGDQQQDKSRQWLSPANPSTNYNIARKAYHDGTATWFIQGTTFSEWEMKGSLLWVYGLRMCFSRHDIANLTTSLLDSGLGKECPLVCTALAELVFFTDT